MNKNDLNDHTRELISIFICLLLVLAFQKVSFLFKCFPSLVIVKALLHMYFPYNFVQVQAF